jgi:hypothetical protein
VAKAKTSRQLCLDLSPGIREVENNGSQSTAKQVSGAVQLEDVRNERYRRVLIDTLRASGLLALKGS